MDATAHALVPDDYGRLFSVDGSRHPDLQLVIDRLRADCVILVRGLSLEQAEALLRQVTDGLGLLDRLSFQATYATSLNRERVGQYNMTVNKRRAYQFIPAHSEGDSLINAQLASFYCFENSTDGGETILLNVEDSSDTWRFLRERVIKIAPGSRTLKRAELLQAKALHHLYTPPFVEDGDLIIREYPSALPALSLVDVLTKARRTYSSILSRDLYAYWSSIAINDRSARDTFVSLLQDCHLLREPAAGLELSQMDNVADSRVWSSDTDHSPLFRAKIVHKLSAGDFVLLNNLTWTHAVSNWNVDSGSRRVVAAFA